ncbi:MAG: cadA: cadmium, zinc and cobalt-transporting ATPase [Clostridiales bacterium]|nr:cadA: cadmium, zinc and cobalt-transporting ATPase [Clostridiales bacterium]
MKRRVLILEGLSCAHCANKIEQNVKKIDGVESVGLDFVSKRLIIEADQSDIDRIAGLASKIAVEIENGISVLDTELNQGNIENKTEALKSFKNIKLIKLVVGAVVFAFAYFVNLNINLQLSLYLVSYLLIGGDILLRAVKNIIKGQVFDENFLMSLATVGAFAIGEYPEGVSVMLFYQVGELFQDMAVDNSRKSIQSLLDIRPDFANLKIEEEIRRVSPEMVNVGDVIIVKPGEKIPLDGIVTDGNSMLDTSALTGESVPRKVKTGDSILSGTINTSGLLTIEVTKEFGESTVSKILELVQNANSRKSPTENFITKFARYYTPAVVIAAAGLGLIPPLLIDGATFATWINRALVFLVVSCPCALVISIPLSFFGGIGAASRKGILVKGGNYLEALNSVDTIVFDKTGTLTKGVFKVTGIYPEHGITREQLLEYAACAESYSNHPIATSIMKEYRGDVIKSRIKDYEELPGFGVKADVEGAIIQAGNSKLMEQEKIDYKKVDAAGSIVHIAIGNRYAGYIVISDELKDDTLLAIKRLREIGVKKLVMLTGDTEFVGRKIGNEIGMDEVYAELLPHQKVEKLELIDKNKPLGSKLIFVGDGINDAPVLARADIGIAMGGLGSDAAIEAADVVLMTDEPSKIVTALEIARKTRTIVLQNIVFALAIKGLVLLLGAIGFASMWEAVFADVGVALLAVLNAMRVMKAS